MTKTIIAIKMNIFLKTDDLKIIEYNNKAKENATELKKKECKLFQYAEYFAFYPLLPAGFT